MLLRKVLVDSDGELLTVYSVRIGERSGVSSTQAARTPALPGKRCGVQSVSRVEGVRSGHLGQQLLYVTGAIGGHPERVPNAGTSRRAENECTSRTKVCS